GRCWAWATMPITSKLKNMSSRFMRSPFRGLWSAVIRFVEESPLNQTLIFRLLRQVRHHVRAHRNHLEPMVARILQPRLRKSAGHATPPQGPGHFGVSEHDLLPAIVYVSSAVPRSVRITKRGPRRHFPPQVGP